MTTQERLNKINKIKESRETAEEREKTLLQEAINSYILNINNLKRRINDLISCAEKCEECGIDVSKFKADGITHHLGFTELKHHHDPYGSYREIVLSIMAGGACGNWGLEVGKDANPIEKNDVWRYSTYDSFLDKKAENKMFVYDKENWIYSRPFKSINYLDQFLNEFDRFEENFYNYIDNL